ncbi:MAG TPA: BatA domain-containing protein [Chthoniobacter sp.]
MAFLNPLLLFGIIGIASPIIIHLLAKKKIKHVVWAAMRFLKEVVEKNQQRLTLEDVLLLLLRCLLLILIALALARPSFKQGGIVGFGDSNEAAIIAIDDSASMSQTDGATSKFEQAQKAAEDVLDSLPSGSSVAVWFVSDVVKSIIPEPTHDFALARKTIREAQRTDHGTEILSSLRRAVEVLQRQPAGVRQLFLITDGQANGWKQLAETRALFQSARDVHPRFVVIGESEQHNLGVTGLRMASALAPANEPVRFEIEVANFGVAEARNVQVSLGIDEDPPSDEASLTAIGPGETKTISLYATFREPGYHAAVARLPADRNPADDQRALAVHVIGETNVLLVDGNPGIEPRESAVFFLRNALTPVPPEQREKYYIKTKTIIPAELSSTKLGDYEAVVLANVVDLPESVLGSLERYLRAGGGLIVFPGGNTNTAFYNKELFDARGILPAAFGEPHGSAEQQEQYFTLQSKDYDHPIVSIWRDPAAGNLATAHFYRAFALLPAKKKFPDAGPPIVVLSYADGQPAVMERTWGFGRVIQFSSTANTAWNDLCIRPIFVPLVHRTLGALLTRQEENLNLRVGAPLRAVVDAELIGKDVMVSAPGGKGSAAGLQRIASVGGVPLLQFAGTDRAGIYEVHQGDDATPLLRFAAQADPAESNLQELSAQDWKTFDGIAQVVHWTPQTNFRGELQRERTGNECWMALVILVLIGAVVETTMGNRWSESR